MRCKALHVNDQSDLHHGWQQQVVEASCLAQHAAELHVRE